MTVDSGQLIVDPKKEGRYYTDYYTDTRMKNRSCSWVIRKKEERRVIGNLLM
ncbi:MAG: hypothetical protein MUE44_28395 [Oscillatoriaceae cyanobacterium Prado104]|nr:hypothetical protein [Oscillatoriaceae cyanobacterium Prado104]